MTQNNEHGHGKAPKNELNTTKRMEYEKYNWERIETDKWERAYRNERGDILYAEDTYKNKTPTNQTDFSDFDQDRYTVYLRRTTAPANTEDHEIHSTMDWNEAEALLEARAEDFK
jgi:hypothetical protein